jgi:hypothetical protein
MLTAGVAPFDSSPHTIKQTPFDDAWIRAESKDSFNNAESRIEWAQMARMP